MENKMKNAAKLMALALALAIGAQLTACADNADTNAVDHAYSKGLDENGFFEGVKASEIVTLPEYKGIDVDEGISVASEEEVNAQIEEVLSPYNSYEQITDRPAADGDTLNIDFVGYIDGEQFDGGNSGGLGTEVTIGVTEYIDGFIDGLVGQMPGEEFDINITFPDDMANEELKGKEAVFKTTINYIRGEFIKAELTDEIAMEQGFNTAEELIADIEDWIVSSDRFYLFSDLLAGATCESIPDSVIEYFKNFDIAQYDYYAQMYGMTTEEFIISNLGYESLDAYVASQTEIYTQNATLYLAAQAIAELENITVTPEMIEEAGYSEYISEYGEPYIKQFMLFQEIIPQFIVDNGNPVDMSEETAETTVEA